MNDFNAYTIFLCCKFKLVFFCCQALPWTTVVALVAIWALVGYPLTVIGGLLGRSVRAARGEQEIEEMKLLISSLRALCHWPE